VSYTPNLTAYPVVSAARDVTFAVCERQAVSLEKNVAASVGLKLELEYWKLQSKPEYPPFGEIWMFPVAGLGTPEMKHDLTNLPSMYTSRLRSKTVKDTENQDWRGMLGTSQMNTSPLELESP